MVARKRLTRIVVSQSPSPSNRVAATMSLTIVSVWGGFRSRNTNPLRVVAKENGAGVKSMKIAMKPDVDRNR